MFGGKRGRAIPWIKMRACSQVVKLNIHPLQKEERVKCGGRVDTATFMSPILTLCCSRISAFSQFRLMAVRCRVWRVEIFNRSYTGTPFLLWRPQLYIKKIQSSHLQLDWSCESRPQEGNIKTTWLREPGAVCHYIGSSVLSLFHLYFSSFVFFLTSFFPPPSLS